MKATLVNEEWRPVAGYEGLYEVSNFGRVKSLNYNNTNCKKNLKPRFIKCGYKTIYLNKNNIQKGFLIHRLVYEAFYGTIPEGMQINHINEIKSDNSIWNLNLMTPKENSNWGTGTKRCTLKRLNGKMSKKVYQYNIDGEFVREWASTRECGRNGFHQSSVAACCRGEKLQYKGYIWKYK